MPTRYIRLPRWELSAILETPAKVESETLADGRLAYYVNGKFVGTRDQNGCLDFASFLDNEVTFLKRYA